MDRRFKKIEMSDVKEIVAKKGFAFVNKKLSHLANKKVSQL